MKIIHCADLHLDSKLTSSLSGEKLVLRRREIQYSFARLVNFALQNDVKVIIICGDLFDHIRARQSVKNEVLEIIAKSSLHFVLIEGNHDFGFDDYFYDNLPINAALLRKDNPSVVIDGVVFTALITQNISFDEDKTNIALFHGDIATYGANTLQTLNLSSLAQLPIDYLALGHIHSYAAYKLSNRGVACYCGCLEGRGFDELGSKGFVLLEVANKKIKHQFVPFSQRTYHLVDVDISGLKLHSQILLACEDALRVFDKSGLIKAVLTGKVTNADIDTVALSSQLSQNCFFVKVVNNTSLQANEISLEPFTLRYEFVQEVLGLDISDAEKELAIKYGLRALLGEEVDTL